MKYTELNKTCEKMMNDLIDRVGVFFAFSNKQFEEGKEKHPVAPGEKYTSIGMGGYLPSKNVEQYLEGITKIDEYRKSEMKRVKREDAILYELCNHESFYTGSIDDAFAVLSDHYSREEVREVYRNNYSKYCE